MSLPTVADADTLFPATTRGLLIYLDFAGLIRLHWSATILDEVARALVDTGRKKTLEDSKAHEARMLVTGNVKDYRKGELAKLGIALRRPDEFIAALFQSQPMAFSAAFRQFRTDLASRPQPGELLERMRKDGLVQSATDMESAFQSGAVML